MFPHVNQATVNVLAAEGCDVVAPSGQGCCGALALHAGRLRRGARLRAPDDRGLRPAPASIAIVVNAAGCGSSMKEYGELLADDPAWAERAHAFSARVRDVSRAARRARAAAARRGTRSRLRVAYHDACHLAHAQGVRAAAARPASRRFPASSCCRFAEPEICCGSAGIYNLVAAGRRAATRRSQGAHHRRARPDIIATGNPGCTLQIARGRRARHARSVLHPIEILDASIRGAKV